jgi:hypothetical protein
LAGLRGWRIRRGSAPRQPTDVGQELRPVTPLSPSRGHNYRRS